VIFPDGNLIVEVLMTIGGFAIIGYFFYRVAFHLRRSGAELLLSPLS
jgi:hypothetical protein